MTHQHINILTHTYLRTARNLRQSDRRNGRRAESRTYTHKRRETGFGCCCCYVWGDVKCDSAGRGKPAGRKEGRGKMTCRKVLGESSYILVLILIWINYERMEGIKGARLGIRNTKGLEEGAGRKGKRKRIYTSKRFTPFFLQAIPSFHSNHLSISFLHPTTISL